MLCGVGLMEVSSPLTIAIYALASPVSTHGGQVRSKRGVPDCCLSRVLLAVVPLVRCCVFSMPHATEGRYSQTKTGDSSSRTRKHFQRRWSPRLLSVYLSRSIRARLLAPAPTLPVCRSPHLLSPCSLSALSSSSRPVSHEHKSITRITNNSHRRPHLDSAQRQLVSLQSLLEHSRYGLRRAAAATLLPCCSASMAHEPRQRRPLPPRVSQDVVPEPEPAYVRPDADSTSDNECEATELRSVTPGQSARRRSRVLSPPASSKVHWYSNSVLSRYWRHHVNITVPHDDCRDHLGKASVLCLCKLRMIHRCLPTDTVFFSPDH